MLTLMRRLVSTSVAMLVALAAVMLPLKSADAAEPEVPEIVVDFWDMAGTKWDQLRIYNSEQHLDKSVEVDGVWIGRVPDYVGNVMLYEMTRLQTVTVDIYRQDRNEYGYPIGPKDLLSSVTYTFTNAPLPPRAKNVYRFAGTCDPSTGLTAVRWDVHNVTDALDAQGRPYGPAQYISIAGERIKAATPAFTSVSGFLEDGERRLLSVENQDYISGSPPGDYVFTIREDGKVIAKPTVRLPSCNPNLPFPKDTSPKPTASLKKLSGGRIS